MAPAWPGRWPGEIPGGWPGGIRRTQVGVTTGPLGAVFSRGVAPDRIRLSDSVPRGRPGTRVSSEASGDDGSVQGVGAGLRGLRVGPRRPLRATLRSPSARGPAERVRLPGLRTPPRRLRSHPLSQVPRRASPGVLLPATRGCARHARPSARRSSPSGSSKRCCSTWPTATSCSPSPRRFAGSSSASAGSTA